MGIPRKFVAASLVFVGLFAQLTVAGPSVAKRKVVTPRRTTKPAQASTLAAAIASTAPPQWEKFPVWVPPANPLTEQALIDFYDKIVMPTIELADRQPNNPGAKGALSLVFTGKQLAEATANIDLLVQSKIHMIETWEVFSHQAVGLGKPNTDGTTSAQFWTCERWKGGWVRANGTPTTAADIPASLLDYWRDWNFVTLVSHVGYDFVYSPSIGWRAIDGGSSETKYGHSDCDLGLVAVASDVRQNL